MKFSAPSTDIHPILNSFLSGYQRVWVDNFLLSTMVSTIYQVSGVNALSEKMGSQNKNIGDNGGGSATCSEYSTERLTEEIAGILSF